MFRSQVYESYRGKFMLEQTGAGEWIAREIFSSAIYYVMFAKQVNNIV